MYDYRDKIKPLDSLMSRLDPPVKRRNCFRRRAVELLVRGYSREEIAGILGREKHNIEVTIGLAKKILGATSDSVLTLMSHGIPVKHDRPLSKYLDILTLSSVRRKRYVHQAISLLARGYSHPEAAKELGKSRHSMSVITRVAMMKLGITSPVELVLLAHDIIDGKDFCLDGILKDLTKRKVSGTLRGNAEQLPGSSAQSSAQEGHADSQAGHRDDRSGRGHALLP